MPSPALAPDSGAGNGIGTNKGEHHVLYDAEQNS